MRKILAVVSDGAPNVACFRRYFREKHPHLLELTCVVHSFNLISKAVLEYPTLETVVKNVLTITASFTKSNKLSERLKIDRLEAGHKQTKLATVASTRFCSVYSCAERLVTFESSVRKVANLPDMKWTRKDVKTIVDDDVFWADARELCGIMKPIFEVLKAFESKKVRNIR